MQEIKPLIEGKKRRHKKDTNKKADKNNLGQGLGTQGKKTVFYYPRFINEKQDKFSHSAFKFKLGRVSTPRTHPPDFRLRGLTSLIPGNCLLPLIYLYQ